MLVIGGGCFPGSITPGPPGCVTGGGTCIGGSIGGGGGGGLIPSSGGGNIGGCIGGTGGLFCGIDINGILAMNGSKLE